jgi:hypothetical protein
VPDTKTELSEIIELKAETFFLGLEDLVENKEVRNKFFSYVLILGSFCGVALLFLPKNAVAETILRKKAKFVETTVVERGAELVGGLAEPVKEVLKSKRSSLVKHRLGPGPKGPEKLISEEFSKELILKVFNEKLVNQEEFSTELILKVFTEKLWKPEVLEVLEVLEVEVLDVIKKIIPRQIQVETVWEPSFNRILEPLVVLVPAIEKKSPLLSVLSLSVLCGFNSFFSGYFSSGLNNLLILMIQNLMVVKFLCLPAYLDWVPLPWGARSAMKSASTLIKLFPKRGEKNKDKEEKSGGSPFNILDFLEKPNKDSKEESILSPGALSSSNSVQILAVFMAAFLFKGKIKSHFSNAIVEVEVLKPLTFYQTLLKFFDPSKPRVYILIGSTTVCIYFYFNRGKFSKNKSVLTLAFEFMEKHLTKETLGKFPDYVPQEKSGAGADIDEKARQNFLKELAKDFFLQAGRRHYYF